MIFEILAEKNEHDQKKFYYDNEHNTLKDEDGFEFNFTDLENIKKKQEGLVPVVPFSKDVPLKKQNLARKVKIQMGLSCNYSCDYCSQKFVERPKETSKKDIDAFMEMFDKLEFNEQTGLSIEFWGGEPFVYWKTMKPLAEAIRDKFSSWKRKPRFSVITNGSILTPEINAWLVYMGFSVSISHDGPGQHVRGPDPLADPKQKKIIMELYEVLNPQKRISFNSMLYAKNQSRKAIHEWFVEVTGDPNVTHGEGGIVDAYDEDGASNSLLTKKDHFEYRKLSFNDIFSSDTPLNFAQIDTKINMFMQSILRQDESKYLGQKCGMDNEDVIAVDLRGNVLTCQNVSAVQVGLNGEQHLGGHISDIGSVEIKTATHWMNREECPSCPVLHICKGACMFLDGKYWEISCANAYSDNIPLFALAFTKLTNGYIPKFINNEALPDDRKDIWGTILDHKEKAVKKIIPIKVVSQKTMVVDGIEVFDVARIE